MFQQVIKSDCLVLAIFKTLLICELIFWQISAPLQINASKDALL